MADLFNDLFEDNEDITIVPTSPTLDTTTLNDSSETKNTGNDFIFCSECGNKIKTSSKYCRHCGAKIDEEISSSIGTIITNQHEQMTEVTTEPILEHKISSDKPIEVKIKSDPSVKKSTIADEIVANLKMIGCAILTWLVYLGAFYVYHQNDIKEFKLDSNDTYWGESCYDPGVMSEVGDMNPEKIYKRLKYYEANPRGYYYGDLGTEVEHENISSTETVPDQYKNDPLYNQAVEEANRNKIDFLENINSIRLDGFKEDFSKHAIWSAFICLLLFVVGRYIIVSVKWIDNNRSK